MSELAKHREMQREVQSLAEIPMALQWARHMLEQGLQRGTVLLTAGRPRRTLDQNAKLWPMLTDVSKQCQLVIDGVLNDASPEDWKDVFTSALRKHQRIAQGIDGGVVFLGMRTSRMNKATFSDLIELIYAYGSEHEIVWSKKAKKTYDEYRRAA